VSANLKVTEPSGREWEVELVPGRVYAIGRAKDNDIILNDRRVSRKHAQIVSEGGAFKIIDGYYENGALTRSVNHVFVNGTPMLEKQLTAGDRIIIGESSLEFSGTAAESVVAALSTPRVSSIAPAVQNAPTVIEPPPPLAEPAAGLDYDDRPLGHTQVQLSANEIIGRQTHLSLETAVATPE